MIREERIIFRRTILDIPLLLFLGSQIISTLLSIDPHTSIFGYYSRFNGGLLSTLCYCLLYWAYVANIDGKSNKKNIIVLLISGFLVSIYGILEHFGHSISCVFVTGKFNDDCWVQDVNLRVFATIGQPNWLAAFLTSLVPLTWYYALTQRQNKTKLIYIALSTIFFLCILFTKSRSGLAGLGVAAGIFWISFWLITFKQKLIKKSVVFKFLIINIFLLFAVAIFGTPWTPSFQELLSKTKTPQALSPQTTTALESGGTESGTIRAIVWRGALDIWKAYPIVGSGVETFAYSYYQFRPVEHNLVSEWDFLYNKAHNEFLNFMATSGTLGIAAYLLLIGVTILLFVKIAKDKNKENQVRVLSISLLSGFVGVSVTNFFGFSVVVTSFLFFLFPAMAIVSGEKQREYKSKKLITSQTIGIAVVSLFALLLFYSIARYWYADYLYALGKRDFQEQKYSDSVKHLTNAIELSPNEAIFHQELANNYSDLALGILEKKDATSAGQIATYALDQTQKALSLSPRNIVVRRSAITVLTKLASFDQSLLTTALDLVNDTIKFAPTDARLTFTLGKLYFRLGRDGDAIDALEKTVQLKSNYTDARIALEALYKKEGQIDKAKEQLEYILKYLNPNDSSLKEELNSLK